MSWVGQPLARHEDGPLVRGFGRYVGDLAAGASFLRFVRSPFASAAIAGITIPEGVARLHHRRPRRRRPGAPAAAAAGLRRHRAIRAGQGPGPLHRRADRGGAGILPGAGRGRRRARGGRARARRRGHRPRSGTGPGRGARARAGGREHAGRSPPPGRRHRGGLRGRGRNRRDRDRVGAPERDAAGGARGPRRLRPPHWAGHAARFGADAAPAAHGHRRLPGHRRSAGAGRRPRCRRRVRPEDAALDGICRGGVAGAPPARRRGLDRGPAREPDGLLPQPRPALHAAGRVRCRGPPDRPRRRPALQCRRLLDLSRDLRGRAADGDGRATRSLRFPPLRRALARRRHPHLPDGALPRRIAPGHHLRDGAADGHGGAPLRHRAGGDPPPQPDPRLPLRLGDRHRL